MKEAIISSSVLIIGMIILRRILHGKISAGMQYALWLLVAARLILPGVTALFPFAMPESDLSLMNLTGQAGGSMENYFLENGIPYETTFFATNLPFLTKAQDGPTSVFMAGKITWLAIFGGIWRIGMVCAALWIGCVNFFFSHYLYKNRTPFPVKDYKFPVYLVEHISSPCLHGFPGRQAVYITKDKSEDPDMLRHILTHEACHASHGDTFWSFLRCALLVVYWFHPLVWLAAFLSKRDCELACDEAVIRKLGEEERISYGRTLVALVTHRTKPSDIVCTATTMTSGGKSMKERINRIVHKPKMLAVTVFTVFVIAVIAAISTFTEASVPETATSDCFQLTLPPSLAKSVYCVVENKTNLQIFHRKSGAAIGQFRAMPLPEAQNFSNLNDIILIGNYGANASLRSYMEGDHTETAEPMHEYSPSSADRSEHTYMITDAGVPGTDSNTGAPDPDSNDSASRELLPNESAVSITYLPNESIVQTETPYELYCYFYVPQKGDDDPESVQTEWKRINNELISLIDTDSLTVLSLDSHSVEESLEILSKNRTPYVGNAINVSKITNALFVPDGLRYRRTTLHTDQEPYEVTIDYILTTDNLADIDQSVLRLNAALLFASVENADVCSFGVDDSTWISYYRKNLEQTSGPLYPYSESMEKITELYNSLLSVTSN